MVLSAHLLSIHLSWTSNHSSDVSGYTTLSMLSRFPRAVFVFGKGKFFKTSEEILSLGLADTCTEAITGLGEQLFLQVERVKGHRIALSVVAPFFAPLDPLVLTPIPSRKAGKLSLLFCGRFSCVIYFITWDSKIRSFICLVIVLMFSFSPFFLFSSLCVRFRPAFNLLAAIVGNENACVGTIFVLVVVVVFLFCFVFC